MRIVILVVCFWFTTSPLYAKIVLSSHRDDAGYEIFTMDTDGGEPIQITNNRHDSFSPTWSPDGRQIAFNRDSHIYVIDADGENLRQLTRHKNNEQDLHPDWSPDGTLIAFDRFTGGAPNRRANIYTMDPVTRFVQRVTDFDFNAQAPKWSPDGQWILFQGQGNPLVRSVRTGRTSGLSPNTTPVSRSGWAVGHRRGSGLSIWNGARARDGTAF